VQAASFILLSNLGPPSEGCTRDMSAVGIDPIVFLSLACGFFVSTRVGGFSGVL